MSEANRERDLRRYMRQGASGGKERSDEWKVVSYVGRPYNAFVVASLQPPFVLLTLDCILSNVPSIDCWSPWLASNKLGVATWFGMFEGTSTMPIEFLLFFPELGRFLMSTACIAAKKPITYISRSIMTHPKYDLSFEALMQHPLLP